MKNAIKALLLVFCALGSLTSQAQFEGVITYSIEYIEVPEEIRGMESMLPSEMTMTFKDENARVEQEIMGGSQVVVTGEQTFVLMDMMGQKIAITMTDEEVAKAKEEAEEPVYEYSDETKTIIGIECKKVVLTTENGDVVIWYTDEVKVGATVDNFEFLDGLPLQYETVQQGMKLRLTAKNILEEDVSDSEFEIPAGYERMTSEEVSGAFGQ